jgi:hypothetical protein
MRSELARGLVAALLLVLLATFVACVRQVTPPGNGLQGGVDDPVEEAIPSAVFAPREDDYTEDHPDLPGVPLSFNTLVLVFEQGVTVGEANALLRDIGAEIVGGIPGITGEAEGILFLRVPTEDHQGMIDLLARLRADPLVKVAVQDGLLTTTLEPRPNDGTPATWTWGATPGGGNWGMERIRAPQLWNLNAAVAKSGRTMPTGVLDVGFANAHEDLVYDENLTVGTQADHGTHVAGTIAATFDNGVGVDGVNPFADLVVNAPAFSGSGTALSVRTSWGQQMSSGFFGLIEDRDDVLVVNASLGYNWGPAGINQNTSAAVHDLVEDQGSIFALAELIYVLLGNDLPLFVVSAGNDSNDIPDGAGGTVLMEARWGSPFAYAGIELDMPNVIVVESVANSAASAGGATRSAFSNLGGDVSAPGSDVLSTSWRSTSPTAFYADLSGTSMAAPHVTGLIGYLFAVDPTLLHSEIVDLLDANAVTVAGGASPRIDAFATVMDVDRVQGGDAVLRMLLDIDDGTPDGNQRVLIPPTTPASDFLGEDADGDGGVGDGSIDMADFRRWRDWLLQVEDPAGLTLDGSADHPKKDVNGDAGVGTPAQENVHPRGDFNGDGQLSRSATRFVPGRVDATVTDLAVLQQLFVDPDYDAAQLPGLIDSADLEIWPAGCLALPDVVSVTSSIRVTGTGTQLESRSHTLAEGPRRVYTAAVHPSGYTARIEAKDAGGATLFSAEQAFPMPLGSDALWRPDCTAPSFTIASYQLSPASPAVLPFSPEGAPCPSEARVIISGDYAKNVIDPVLIFARPLTQGSLTPNYAASGSIDYVDLEGRFGQYFCVQDDAALETRVDQVRLTIERPVTYERLYEEYVDVDYLFVRSEPRSLCIDFEDPPFVLGTRYGSPAGDSPGDVVFTTEGVPVTVENFTLGAYTGFSNAEVMNSSSLPGQSMWISNINLRFDFAGLDFAVDKVTFDFQDLGGAENVAVNGSAIVEGELASGTVGAVPLTITRSDGVGDGVLIGSVTDLTIGGQEFFLDNVCAFEAP